MRRLKFYLTLLLLLLLAGYGATVFPVPFEGGLELLRTLGLLLALVAGLLGSGRSLLAMAHVYTISLKEELVFSFGLGCLVFFMLAGLLGFFGWLQPLVAYLLVGVTILVSSEHLERFAHLLRRGFRRPAYNPLAQGLERPSGGMEWMLQAAIALTAIPVLLLALAPITHYDSLVYHLALPQAWARSGMALPQPANLFTWLPGAGEHLTALCLLLDGPRLASLFNLLLAVVLGLALWDSSLRFLPRARPVLAVALCLGQPLVALGFGITTGEGLMTLLLFLAFNAFLRSVTERNHQLQRSWAGVCALLSGAAVAVKPTAGLGALALALLMLWRLRGEAPFRDGKLWLVLAGFFLLPLLPWLIRNGVLMGNPIYPFGLAGWGPHLAPASPTYHACLRQFGFSSQPWTHWWRLPWALFFEPSRFGAGGMLSPIFLALLPALLWAPLSREMRLTLAFLALGFLAWLCGPQVLRYLAQGLPMLALLAAQLFTETEALAASRTWEALMRAVLCAALLLSAAQTGLIVIKDFDPAKVALGLQSQEEYLQQRVNYLPVARWASQHMDETGRLLVLGDSRSAYLPGRPLAASVFERHPFSDWLAGAHNPEELDRIVLGNGFKYVLINQLEWSRVNSGNEPHYRYWDDERGKALYEAWARSYLVLRCQEDGAALYRVRLLPAPPASGGA
jgi:hypothetical protein